MLGKYALATVLLWTETGALLAQEAANYALQGVARSWHSHSVASVPCALVNDDDPLSFWGSNSPTTDPPKDIGIEWAEPRTFACVRVRFYSERYVPAAEGWRLEALSDGRWQPLEALVENAESARWTFRFDAITTTAVRLFVERYAKSRPAVNEFEVYEGNPPRPPFRRPPVLDGAFWAFHYEGWASHYETDDALAAEVDAAHAIGLDTIILYAVTGRNGRYSTAVPKTVVSQSPWWRGRDPIEAILSRADALGMHVYISDTTPNGYMHKQPTPEAEAESTRLLGRYRRQVLDRYADHASLVGYYMNFECLPDDYANDATLPAAQAEALAIYIKGMNPNLKVIQPVGLYRWRDTKEAPWRHVTPAELSSFWKPFIAAAQHIDVFMVIDGIGTGLSPLNHTDVNQASIRNLCDQHDKEMWTDVECAEMGRRYVSYPIGRLIPALEVAATHVEHIVTFDYINYMSPGNGRSQSAALYRHYKAYREDVLSD
ncbi:MAG: DUF4434 domain-containing protein [Pirellulaceae bacterium]|nr:DUF4434 domain-containing protein [Pirellulaceae bacterium]